MKKLMGSFKKIGVQLNYVLNREQKRGAVIILFCMLISSGMELLGVSTIYPFLQMILDADSIQDKWYIECIRALFPEISMQLILVVMGLIIMVIYILKNLLLLLSNYVQNTYAAKMRQENSVSVLDAYLRRPYEFF